jgi:hypothetical protein
MKGFYLIGTVHVLILIALMVACTSTYNVQKLPHPDTGREVDAVVETKNLAGLPVWTKAPEFPAVKLSGSQLSDKQRSKVANWGGWFVIAGIILLVIGVAVHLSVTIPLAQRLSEAVALAGAGGIVSGLLMVGFAIAWGWALLVGGFAFIGFIMYLMRTKGFIKWQSKRSASNEQD